MDDIENFGKELAKLREDASMRVAEAVDMGVCNDGQRLAISFETLSGKKFSHAFSMPNEWVEGHPLVTLLEYWEIDPATEMDKIVEDAKEVPIRTEGESRRIDFDEIYRLLDQRNETEIEVEGTDDG